MVDSKLTECVSFFQNTPGFARIFTRFKDKYKSLGKIGGKIVLTKLTGAEKKALTGYFRNDFTRQKQATIRLDKFEQALDKTRFAGLLLEDILMAYFAEEEIISNKRERNLYLEARENFFVGIMTDFSGTLAGRWLNDVLTEGNNAYSILIKRYNTNREKLKLDIYQVGRAFNNLPCFREEKKRLAVFASEITKNPHAFDQGEDCDLLLQAALSYHFQIKRPENAEERAELYYQAGILVNEVANYTLCSGLEAYLDGKKHPGWSGFYNLGEPVLVSLMNLSRLERIISPSGKVFVFENTAVFSTVQDYLPDRRLPLVCTGGQLKLASLLLLDMLADEDTYIYYAGDFDPEGLQIADRLKKRYGTQLHLWRYSQSDYNLAASREIISDWRLKKLDNIQDIKLLKIATILARERTAGYQELLIEQYVADIEEISKDRGETEQ